MQTDITFSRRIIIDIILLVENGKYIEEFLSYLKNVQGYSEKTVISYAHDLERLEKYMELHSLSVVDFEFEDAREFTSELYDKDLSGATINRILSSCRSFFHNLCLNGVRNTHPFVRIKRAKQEQRIPTVLSKAEVEQLIGFKPENYEELTELTMFNLFYSTGCRLSELLEMKISDIDIESRRVLVTGKGSKQRYVFLSHRAVLVLKDYLPERADVLYHLKKEDPGVLLINKKGNALPVSTVHSIFDKYRIKLGLTKKFTPHVFRHTFATDLLDNNSDIRVVQTLLGHESIGTTQIYTHVTSSKLENVYRNAHPHGRKK